MYIVLLSYLTLLYLVDDKFPKKLPFIWLEYQSLDIEKLKE